jgi:hypothetical protein
MLLDFSLQRRPDGLDKVYDMLGLAKIGKLNSSLTISEVLQVDFTKDGQIVFWDTIFGSEVPFHELVPRYSCSAT